MFAPKLPPDLHAAVLKRLHFLPGKPDLPHLDRLVNAYVRTVPWESAFRIVKRAEQDVVDACSRWPEEYWQDHLRRGSGGTCFESNFAFSSLLHELGYKGYLTINDMQESIGCHTAIIVLLEGQKWLVDTGFPIYAPLPIESHSVSQRTTPFHQYTIRPEGDGRYQIERRPHPNWYAFTLIDRPVSLAEYRQATTADYGPNGHFLQRVIIHKILDEQMWRFNSSEKPPQLTRFGDGQRFDHPIDGNVATALAAKFSIDEVVVSRALDLIPAAEPDVISGAGE